MPLDGRGDTRGDLLCRLRGLPGQLLAVLQPCADLGHLLRRVLETRRRLRDAANGGGDLFDEPVERVGELAGLVVATAVDPLGEIAVAGPVGQTGQIRDRSGGTCGSPRVHARLRRRGVPVGRTASSG